MKTKTKPVIGKGDSPARIVETLIVRLKKASPEKPVSRKKLKEVLRRVFPQMEDRYVNKYVSDTLSWYVKKRKKELLALFQPKHDYFYVRPRNRPKLNPNPNPSPGKKVKK